MINFNVPPIVGTEIDYIRQAIEIIKSVVMEHLQNNVLNGLKKIQEQPRHC